MLCSSSDQRSIIRHYFERGFRYETISADSLSGLLLLKPFTGHKLGDTESRIVVNFDTTRAIPHIHYVGRSRVTTIEGLHITNLCENKIAVSPDVQTEMKQLRNSGHLNLSVLPLYTANSIPLKIYKG